MFYLKLTVQNTNSWSKGLSIYQPYLQKSLSLFNNLINSYCFTPISNEPYMSHVADSKCLVGTLLHPHKTKLTLQHSKLHLYTTTHHTIVLSSWTTSRHPFRLRSKSDAKSTMRLTAYTWPQVDYRRRGCETAINNEDQRCTCNARSRMRPWLLLLTG